MGQTGLSKQCRPRSDAAQLVCLSVCLSVRPSVHPSVCQFVSLSVRPLCMYVCMYVCPTLCYRKDQILMSHIQSFRQFSDVVFTCQLQSPSVQLNVFFLFPLFTCTCILLFKGTFLRTRGFDPNFVHRL